MQTNHRKNRHLKAQRLNVQVRVIALNEARLFQRAHTAQAGRRGNADPFGQVHIGDATILLQSGKNLEINGVELRPLHFIIRW